ncbi:MAG: hypothetical protein RIQ33_2266 [Bacteroidota bacterium]
MKKSHLRIAPYHTLLIYIVTFASNNKKLKTLESLIFQAFEALVPRAGVEPAQPLSYRFLRPTRLPIPPSGHLVSKINLEINYLQLIFK